MLECFHDDKLGCDHSDLVFRFTLALAVAADALRLCGTTVMQFLFPGNQPRARFVDTSFPDTLRLSRPSVDYPTDGFGNPLGAQTEFDSDDSGGYADVSSLRDALSPAVRPRRVARPFTHVRQQPQEDRDAGLLVAIQHAKACKVSDV